MIGNIEPDDQYIAECGQLCFLVWRTHGGDDVPAFFMEEFGRCLADARRSAGDENGFSHCLALYKLRIRFADKR
jgi:hypothetical protein